MSVWQVHWVRRTPVPDGDDLWSREELLARESAARINEDSPFMTSPDGDVDPVLTAYFNSAGFRRLAPDTQKSYTDDYKTFFNFLWQRGKRWTEASTFDFEDYEDWRRRAPSNPRPISGSKWVREASALNRLYRWAVQWHVVETSPIRTVERRGPNGTTVETMEAAARDVRTTNVKWLTPRMSRLWRDVGMLGHGADGRPDPSFRGRMADRNAAFADLLFDSGLRRTEAASLLTLELPVNDGRSRYQWTRVARAVAKYGSGRPFCVSTASLSRIRAYEQTGRADAIRAAQSAGRYEAIDGKWIVTNVRTSAMATTVEWVDTDTGVVRSLPIDRLKVDERARLYRETPDGLEPLWFWLAEDGLPFGSHSWEAVFYGATQRCQRIIGDGAPYATPHMARHSFALVMLLAMQHALDTRFGLDERQRLDYERLYGNPWRMVKDLLGHKSEETTRNVYLAPVRDVQVRTLLEGGDLSESVAFLQALAASGRVQDLAHA